VIERGKGIPRMRVVAVCSGKSECGAVAPLAQPAWQARGGVLHAAAAATILSHVTGFSRAAPLAALVLASIVAVAGAQDDLSPPAEEGTVTLAPDGSYVGGGTYTLTPDGDYVGGDTYSLTPDGRYVGGDGYSLTPEGEYVGGATYTLTPDGKYVGGDEWVLTPDGAYVGSGGSTAPTSEPPTFEPDSAIRRSGETSPTRSGRWLLPPGDELPSESPAGRRAADSPGLAPESEHPRTSNPVTPGSERFPIPGFPELD
jgi:hypothetical protein